MGNRRRSHGVVKLLLTPAAQVPAPGSHGLLNFEGVALAGKRIELAGKIFGSLRLLTRAEPDAQRRAHWNCVCDPELGGCGRPAVVRGDSLTSGKTQSCGECNGTESKPPAAKKESPWLGLLFPRFQVNVIPSRYGSGNGGSLKRAHWTKCKAPFVATPERAKEKVGENR
jgi:hypothetical protein